MLGFLIIYGALAAVTGVAVANADSSKEYDPWIDDNYPYEHVRFFVSSFLLVNWVPYNEEPFF